MFGVCIVAQVSTQSGAYLIDVKGLSEVPYILYKGE
jgi:hypothetical protein